MVRERERKEREREERERERKEREREKKEREREKRERVSEGERKKGTEWEVSISLIGHAVKYCAVTQKTVNHGKIKHMFKRQKALMGLWCRFGPGQYLWCPTLPAVHPNTVTLHFLMIQL